MPTRQENIKRFENLMKKVKREGINDLMDYIRKDTDFYEAPSSSMFHLSCEGGLLQHSLNVYDCLIAKKNNPVWKGVFETVSEESLIIIALMHDLCKVNFYTKSTKNQKTYDPEKVKAAQGWQIKHDNMGDFIWETVLKYDVDDKEPLGHAEKSVIMLSKFIRLTDEEIYAIRWHMGYTEPKELYKSIGNAYEKYPIALAFHEADLEASSFIEGTDKNKRDISSLPFNNALKSGKKENIDADGQLSFL